MAAGKKLAWKSEKTDYQSVALPLIILFTLSKLLYFCEPQVFVCLFVVFVCKWINNIYQAQLRYSVNGKAVPSLLSSSTLLLLPGPHAF